MAQNMEFCQNIILLTITVSYILCGSQAIDIPFGGYYCLARCTAKCLESSGANMEKCQQTCEEYNKDALCSNEDCWLRCNDLVSGIISRPAAPSNLRLTLSPTNSSLINLQWSTADQSQLYIVQYKDNDDAFHSMQSGGNGRYMIVDTNFEFVKPNLCPSYQFAVAAVNKYGISQFSDIQNSPKGRPRFRKGSKISVVQTEFIDEEFMKYNESHYKSQVRLRIEYDPPIDWDVADLLLESNRKTAVPDAYVVTHNTQCKQPKPAGIIPGINLEPVANPGGKPQFDIYFTGYYMDSKCDVLIQLDKVGSKKCGTVGYVNPSGSQMGKDMIVYRFDCKTITNASCKKPKFTGIMPTCGFKNNHFDVTFEEEEADASSEIVAEGSDKNMTAIITWNGTELQNKGHHRILYYAVRIGNYTKPNQNQFSAITMFGTEYGRYRSCDTGPAALDTTSCQNQSVRIRHLPRNTSYAIQMCAVHDPKYEFAADVRNKSQPDIAAASLLTVPSEEEIIERHDGRHLAAFIAGPLGFAGLVAVGVVFIMFAHSRRQKKKMQKLQVEMNRLAENEDRYTNLPKKNDVWELERRRLIVYEDKRLGAGAFGAVYKGKIIGKVQTLKACESSLAANLMRVENCDVAVKKLPEYADELSKRDFMQEINLMKELGYHENLVNMLACITETEPYCLVVEFCSEGDLKQFLAERRHYMLKLVENGIDYCNMGADDVVDVDMVLTMKELLAFAVQISYGLEYLTQKRFIHRDVAARNVMVHNKRYAKIGDFGLCRYTFQDDSAYWGKGGKLPIKWMAPEAIKNNHFTTASDV